MPILSWWGDGADSEPALSPTKFPRKFRSATRRRTKSGMRPIDRRAASMAVRRRLLISILKQSAQSASGSLVWGSFTAILRVDDIVSASEFNRETLYHPVQSAGHVP